MPGIDDLVVFRKQVRHAELERRAFGRTALHAVAAAHNGAVGVVHAAGEAPLAVQHEAAVHRLHRSAAGKGGGDDGVRVVRPEFLLGAHREAAQHPGVGHHHGRHPGRGAAAAAEFAGHVHMRAPVHLESAVAPGREDLVDSRRLEIGHGFIRQRPEFVGGLGALAEYRHQFARLAHQFLACRNVARLRRARALGLRHCEDSFGSSR